MLFLSVFTFDAENRDAVIQRCAQLEGRAPEGVQMHIEVVDLTKNRVFRICEVTDPKAILEANMVWGDLGEIETIPVMRTDEMLETLDRMKNKDLDRKRHAHPIELSPQHEL